MTQNKFATVANEYSQKKLQSKRNSSRHLGSSNEAAIIHGMTQQIGKALTDIIPEEYNPAFKEYNKDFVDYMAGIITKDGGN